MKKPLVFSMFMITLLMGGCATTSRQHVTPTTQQVYSAKNSSNITIYKENNPLTPYKVIGVAHVSKYNLFGTEREDETVHGIMKELAASIGGDGVINMNDDGKDQVQAKIIQYQKILI